MNKSQRISFIIKVVLLLLSLIVSSIIYKQQTEISRLNILLDGCPAVKELRDFDVEFVDDSADAEVDYLYQNYDTKSDKDFGSNEN
jgi:hypothetical protein